MRARAARRAAALLIGGLVAAGGLVVVTPSVAGADVIEDDFEDGFANWTPTGLWNVEEQSDDCGQEAAPFPAGPTAAYFGSDETCNFDFGNVGGTLTYNSTVVVEEGDSTLRFHSWHDSECGDYDRKTVEVNDGEGWEEVYLVPCDEDGEPTSLQTAAFEDWSVETVDLSAYIGQEIGLRFRFDATDGIANDGVGWFVDGVGLAEEPASGGVSVTASTPTAEEGGAPGAFTFQRTGDTSQQLTIGYGTSGTATGDDYTPMGLVTFPIGQTTVVKDVVATDDGVAEGDETLTVTLFDGDDYDIAVPISATVTITDPIEPVDPCANLDDPAFTDVPDTNVHAANIDCLAALGYTVGGPGGRPADQYGPRLPTTRGQMASFIARIAEDLGVELPAEPDDAFDDDDTSVHELRINQLTAVRIIGDNGEDGRSYRPGDTITREEMASFLNRLIGAVTGAPLASDVDAFTDDEESPYEADINGLASEEIVLGTGGGLYDPDGTVQRDSMASFLIRTIQYLANQA